MYFWFLNASLITLQLCGMKNAWLSVWLTAVGGCAASSSVQNALPAVAVSAVTADRVQRVTTAVPFPRGLAMLDGKLFVLARGRVRESGGVDGAIDDHAGHIYAVDPNIGEPISTADVSHPVRENAHRFAVPTEPPFKLFDRTAIPVIKDRETDRPYCGLRYDPMTKNFFVCAFSGIDKPEGKGSTFSKNLSDGVHRYDTRDGKWRTVEKHDIEMGGIYPHHDVASQPPPHGWLNGPDNCLAVGKWLYAVAKDNSVMVRYDLSEIAVKPDAGAPASEWVLGEEIEISNLPLHVLREGEIAEGSAIWESSRAHGETANNAEPALPPAPSRSTRRGRVRLLGHSMMAYRDGYLYIGYRTSSAIVRVRMSPDGELAKPIVGELIAQFDPYDSKTRKSANLTDMSIGPDGDVYVISAQPSRVFRFHPDPQHIFDARSGTSKPWADLAVLTNNPKMKSENILVDPAGRVFITSGDAYAYQSGGGGTVYRIDP